MNLDNKGVDLAIQIHTQLAFIEASMPFFRDAIEDELKWADTVGYDSRIEEANKAIALCDKITSTVVNRMTEKYNVLLTSIDNDTVSDETIKAWSNALNEIDRAYATIIKLYHEIEHERERRK